MFKEIKNNVEESVAWKLKNNELLCKVVEMCTQTEGQVELRGSE